MKEERLHKKNLRRIFFFILFLFGLLNLLVAIQAYSWTHFSESSANPRSHTTFTYLDIAKMLIFGIDIEKPTNKVFPNRNYETIHIKVADDKELSAWVMHTESASKGMVIFFHGYVDEKSALLHYAYNVLDMGYDVMLLDFMAAGNSYGLQSTVGYKEADNVKSAFDYAYNNMKQSNIYLFGFSMGATAIIRAQYKYNMPVKGLIAEASYGKMYLSAKARIKRFVGPLNGLIGYLFTFWIGVVNGYNSFSVNPEEYAKTITVPCLIACGGKDQFITQDETRRIYNNLAGTDNVLKFYPDCKHELYLTKYSEEWKNTVKHFLDAH